MRITRNKRVLTALLGAAALALIGVSSLVAPREIRFVQTGCPCGRALRWLEPAGSDHATQYRLETASPGDPKHVHEYDAPQTIEIFQMSLWDLWKFRRTHEQIRWN